MDGNPGQHGCQHRTGVVAMRVLGAIVAVLILASAGHAATRYVSGVGFPTTETPGGESLSGTVDWGDPSDIATIDYSLEWGDDDWTGTMGLLATNIAGTSAQMIYADPANDLVLTAISADGPFDLDADLFLDTEGYGGFEAWTLTNTGPSANKYGTITGISSVPEPGLKIVALSGGLCLLVFRRKFLRWSAHHAMAGA